MTTKATKDRLTSWLFEAYLINVAGLDHMLNVEGRDPRKKSKLNDPNFQSFWYASYAVLGTSLFEAVYGTYSKLANALDDDAGLDTKTGANGSLPLNPISEIVASLWGIRIAFTQSDGTLSGIINDRNRTWAEQSPGVFPSVKITDGRLGVTRQFPTQASLAFQRLRHGLDGTTAGSVSKT